MGSWWSQWESYDGDVTIIHASIDGPWTDVKLALLFHIAFVFYLVFLFLILCSLFFCLFLEFSVASWRSVNLTLLFLNRENGDIWILMRDISPAQDFQRGMVWYILFCVHIYDLLDLCINRLKEKLDSTVITQVLPSPGHTKSIEGMRRDKVGGHCCFLVPITLQ